METITNAGRNASPVSTNETGATGQKLTIQVRVEAHDNGIIVSWVQNHHMLVDRNISDRTKTSACKQLTLEIVKALLEHENCVGDRCAIGKYGCETR